MSCVVRFFACFVFGAGGVFSCAFYALLSEADGFGFAVFFGYDDVGFGGVVGCPFGFVVAAYSSVH